MRSVLGAVVIAVVGCQTVGEAPVMLPAVVQAPESPDAWVFSAREAGAPGPEVEVLVQQLSADQYRVTVNADGKTRSAELTAEALSRLHITSRGGDGARGAPGQPGVSGRDAAPCEHGGDGTKGGDGGPGGAGGRGGTVTVSVDCGAARCSPQLRAMLEANISSQGGAGGIGGAAGKGGRRGYGGFGRLAQTSTGLAPVVDFGCQAGVEGSPGESGLQGHDGLAGPAGERVFNEGFTPRSAGPQ